MEFAVDFMFSLDWVDCFGMPMIFAGLLIWLIVIVVYSLGCFVYTFGGLFLSCFVWLIGFYVVLVVLFYWFDVGCMLVGRVWFTGIGHV